MNIRAIPTLVAAMILWAAASASGLQLGTQEAAAWTTGACTTATGVTVVIDFQELGGGIHIRCAPGPVTSGFDALSQAGIDYQTTIRQPGFLCKIGGKPSNDPCIDASPATAYWSYWLAPRGGTWCYSNWGAGNRTPPAGSVEGWSFSLNKTASTSPPPGTPPPPATPGVPTGTLSGNDCDPRSSAPKPTTTTTAPQSPGSPTTTPPKPTSPSNGSGASDNPAAGDGSAAAHPSGSPASGSNTMGTDSPGDSTAVFPEGNGGAASSGDESSQSGSDDAEAVDATDEAKVAGVTAEADAGQASKTARRASGKESASGHANDANLNVSRAKSSPIGVVLAFLVAVGIGTIAVVRRRGA